MPMVDLCDVAGGLQARRIRGRTFTLWPNAVETNKGLPPGLRLNDALAQQLQDASRAALLAVGFKKKEVEQMEYKELYPECKCATVRQMSREAMKAYHKAAPHPAPTFVWMQLIAGQEGAEAAEEAAAKAAKKTKKAGGGKQKAEGGKQKAEAGGTGAE